MNSRNTQKEQQKDEIKRACTPEKMARWIANETGEKANRSGRCWRVGKGGTGGSIVISQDADGAVIFDHANADLKGDVFEAVTYYRRCKDFTEALRIAADEIACMPLYDHTEAAADGQNDRRAPQTAAERKPVYERFMERYKDALVSGLNSPAFERMMSARGLDASKIATLPRIGFALDDTGWINSPKAEIKGFKAVKNSIVVWNETDFTIKALEIDEKTGKRSGVIRQLGSCHWIPFDKQPDGAVYICEGETSAIALMFAGISGQIPAFAIPLKPEGDGEELIRQYAAKSKRIYLAYDNDAKGRELTETAKKIAPYAIDMSALWSGNEWTESADPNDFVKRYGGESGEKITEWIECQDKHTEGEGECQDKHTADTDAERKAAQDSIKTVDDVLAYFKAKNDARPHTECSVRFYNDELFGRFCYNLDPYGIRRFAPVANLVAYAVARLAKYRKIAGKRILTEQRIINICGKTQSGKNWVLGLEGSHALAYQLEKESDCYSVSQDNAQPTGNGLALYALNFAANDKNKGLVKVIIHPESGNALTQGYDAVKRTGSLSSFDIGLSSRRVDVPKTGTALKDFKDYNESYCFEGVCVRAFQNVNAQKVIIPRFAGGGESRRETWFAITHPINDDMCNNRNRQLFEDVLDYSFDTEKCDCEFDNLRKRSLPFNPERDHFDDPPKDTIRIDTSCTAYRLVYETLLETVKNAYFRQDKCALICSQLQFMTALCAGLHGRYEANDDDYWCAGYIVEVLSRSLDMIAEWDNRPENTETLHAQLLGFVERAGAAGVRADSIFRKFPDGKRALDEMLAGDNGEGAPIFRMIDAGSKKGNAFYFASEFRDEVSKNERFRTPMK